MVLDVLVATSGASEVLIFAAAAVLAGLVGWIAKATMSLIKSRQSKQRDDERAEHTLSQFFFDQERDPRTGTPATVGWTSRVDQTLGILTAGQSRTEAAQRRIEHTVQEIAYELKPNGGGNLRAIVEMGAQAAGVEVVKQEDERVQQTDERTLSTAERGRVQQRDARWDDSK